MSSHHAALENFKARLAQLVGRKAFDLKADLLKEQSQLEGYTRSIDTAKQDAKRVVGEIAIGSMVSVEKKFRDIVLRGDVGIVDVAWQLKEERTHEISRRVSEQSKELQVLDAEFREVLQE